MNAPTITSKRMSGAEAKRAVEDAPRKLRKAIKIIQEAVNPHAFNCGYVKHPTAIKMIPVVPMRCTCGVDEFLK